MKLSDLLENRSSSENVVYDFSKLTRDELAVFVNSQIDGEESLSDPEMQLLESGTAKIIERAGKPRKYRDDFPEFNPGIDDAGVWLKKRIVWQMEKR